MGNSIYNAGGYYDVLDRAGNNLLLRRQSDGCYVIAHGWRGEGNGWDAGKYYGEEKEVATETFRNQYSEPGSYGYR